jgi:segregation and condensation protein B
MMQVLGVDEERLRAALRELTLDYEGAGRGLRIEEVGGGFRIATRGEVAPFLRRLSKLRHRRRLSQAALETLAVISYRQPITTPEIQEIRGVNPDGPLKTLLERRLVRITGKKKVVGRPLLYGTTRDFLIHFGLNSLDDLPPIEDFEKVFSTPPLDESEVLPVGEDDSEEGEENSPALFGEEE